MGLFRDFAWRSEKDAPGVRMLLKKKMEVTNERNSAESAPGKFLKSPIYVP